MLGIVNEGRSTQRQPQPEDQWNWIVGDFNTQYEAEFSDGEVVLKGPLFRYYRLVNTDTNPHSLYYFKVERIVDCEHPTKDDEISCSGFFTTENNPTFEQYHDSLHFARHIALLRGIYTHNRSTWTDFVSRASKK